MAVKVYPSILSADYSKLGEELKKIGHTSADGLQIDVMDLHFVPNLTFGWSLVEQLRKKSRLFFDAHLMIDKPEKWWEKFSAAGADAIVIHLEACKSDESAKHTLRQIGKAGKMAGISIKPRTPLSRITEMVEEGIAEYVLVMTVEPGFGGQKFDHVAAKKIGELRKFADERALQTDIGVDGGINVETSKIARELGANVIISGTEVFKKKTAKEMDEVVKKLRGEQQ